eukprot:6192521-Pleurochrysis_carterae.AAC.2
MSIASKGAHLTSTLTRDAGRFFGSARISLCATLRRVRFGQAAGSSSTETRQLNARLRRRRSERTQLRGKSSSKLAPLLLVGALALGESESMVDGSVLPSTSEMKD